MRRSATATANAGPHLPPGIVAPELDALVLHLLVEVDQFDLFQAVQQLLFRVDDRVCDRPFVSHAAARRSRARATTDDEPHFLIRARL